MMKNLTPFQLIIYTVSIVTALIAIIFSLLNVFLQIIEWTWLILLIICFALITFIAFKYVIEVFIYRKIKLIYKTINSNKMLENGGKKRINVKTDVIDEVNAEVKQWMNSKSSEVSQLKETESYRREFLANVSHELKTPLFNIQGYVHTLIDGGLEDSSINKKYLKKAAKNIDHLNNIVLDLEIISRLESGQVPIRYEKFEIVSLINEILESLELQAEKNDIRMRIKDGCTKPQLVLADKEKIKQ